MGGQSLLSRVATEATAQWVASHLRPERRHRPPWEAGLRKKQLRRARKSLVGRYYQRLSGHAAIGPSQHERMTGAQKLGRAGAGGATEAGGSRATAFSLSAEPGPPDQETVEEDRQGLWVGAPEGTGGQVGVG